MNPGFETPQAEVVEVRRGEHEVGAGDAEEGERGGGGGG